MGTAWHRAAGSARRRLFSGAALVLIATMPAVPVATGAVGDERPLTVDDILKLSDVGRAAVRPKSDTFVWEQSPPYDTLSDYGAGTTGTWQGSDYEIFTAGPDSNAPKRLFRPHSRTTYRLGSFSPDGRFLTLLAMRDGEVRLAAYDFRRHRVAEFGLAPRFPGVQPDPDWAWLDDRHLAVAAYPPGEGPWPLTFRRAIAAHLTESWAKSWRGQEPSVDRYDSSVNESSRQLPGRLVVVDMVSGHIREMASGQFSGLRPSSDGRWLAAIRQSMLPQSTLEHPHIDWTYARSTLVLFSLKERNNPRQIAPELDVLADSMEWNPTSQRLVFFAPHVGADLSSGHFWILDPLTATADMLPHSALNLASQRARGGPQWPERAVWLGDSLAVLARPAPDQAGRLTFEDITRNGVVDPRVESASVPPHWFLLAKNTEPRDLTPGMQTVSPIPFISNSSQFIVFGDGQAWVLDASHPPMPLFPKSPQLVDILAYQDFFHQVRTGGGFFALAGSPETLAQISLSNGSPIFRLLPMPSESSVLALSESGTALAQAGFGKGAQLVLMHPASKPTTLGKLNPFLDRIAETRWTNFNYSNADASKRERLSGCLLLPADYRPGNKYPVIVEVYPDRPGGCAEPAARHHFAMAAHPTSYSEHLLAARGFIVLRPDTGGGISRTADGPQAALPLVVDRAIDALLAAGYGDPTRIGLLGFSQGGFASLWVATQSQRYKAIVSLNGWSDLVSSFFGMSWSQELVPTEMPPQGGLDRYLTSAGSDFSMEGTPWQFPQRYIQNSPLWRSDAISAPVLLIHSDMDEFDDEEYKSFFTSLYIQKKDAKLLIYRGEGHSPSSPANIKDMWKNIFSWFDQYLNVHRDADGKMILSK
jgi:dipeptidyl aminopeptidase/acylaminoacyl peptidase